MAGVIMGCERKIERYYKGLPWYKKIVFWVTILFWVVILAPFWAWNLIAGDK